VLVVKTHLPNEDAAAHRGDTRKYWWTNRRANAAHGTESRRQNILDNNHLQYDLETLPVDLRPDEPEQVAEEIIGVLILRHVPSPSNNKLSRKGRGRGGRAWIRGWAVSRSFSLPFPLPKSLAPFSNHNPITLIRRRYQ